MTQGSVEQFLTTLDCKSCNGCGGMTRDDEYQRCRHCFGTGKKPTELGMTFGEFIVRIIQSNYYNRFGNG